MSIDRGTRPVFRVGRVVNWIVLVLIFAAIIYSIAISVANWRAIYV